MTQTKEPPQPGEAEAVIPQTKGTVPSVPEVQISTGEEVEQIGAASGIDTEPPQAGPEGPKGPKGAASPETPPPVTLQEGPAEKEGSQQLFSGLLDWMKSKLNTSTVGDAYLKARNQAPPEERQPPLQSAEPTGTKAEPTTFFQRVQNLFLKK